MEYARQEYWSELPFPPTGDLPDPRIEPVSPSLAGYQCTTWESHLLRITDKKKGHAKLPGEND